MTKYYISVITLFFLFSCGVNKVQTDKNLKTSNKQILGKFKNETKIPKHTWLKGAASIYQNEKNIKLSLNIKTTRDSVIWCSVSGPLNIEFFRILLTNDSLFLIDRLNKNFYKKSIQDLKNYLNSSISISDIQSLLFAKPDLTKKNSLITNTDTSIIITNKQKEKSSSYIIDRKNHKLISVIFLDENLEKNNTFRLDYIEYKSVEEYVIPKQYKLLLDAIIRSRKEQVLCKIHFSKISILEQQEFIFNIPDSYVQVN